MRPGTIEPVHSRRDTIYCEGGHGITRACYGITYDSLLLLCKRSQYILYLTADFEIASYTNAQARKCVSSQTFDDILHSVVAR